MNNETNINELFLPDPEGVNHDIVMDRGALKNECELFNFQNPQVDPFQLAADLSKTMIDHNGLGLAANQIGYPYRVFAMRTAPKITIVFNPTIVHFSPETMVEEEGCLSFPGFVVKIKRSKLIKVRYAFPDGSVKNEVYKDMTARIFQHEYDHLNGVLYQERATLFHKDQAERKMKQRAKFTKQLMSAKRGGM